MPYDSGIIAVVPRTPSSKLAVRKPVYAKENNEQGEIETFHP
jgi:hypothetical protein